jgi:glycosyltransferase involved in cell wall biosynthesis
MKISVLINNFNYQNYVVDAVESVLNQSVFVDEIIVVDDCSSDASVEILKQKFSDTETVKLILQDQNRGQLSAFQSGFAASTGDLICFLDADDLYHETYVETVLKFYQEHRDCGFLFSSAELFGQETRIATMYELDDCIDQSYRDLGYSRISTLCRRTWIGHRTSTLSMRRAVLEQIFPIPYLEDWRIRADDCLVYGASIMGARKYYLAHPLVKYRVHGSNGHYGRAKERTLDYLNCYEQAVDRLFAFWSNKFRYPKTLCEQVHLEFCSIPIPTRKELEIAQSIVRSLNTSKFKKAWLMGRLYFHFFRHGKFRVTA